MNISVKQHVSIARNLVGRPKILLFDEPTSELDADSERTISKTIKELRGNTTCLVVAHRPETVEACDSEFKVVSEIP